MWWRLTEWGSLGIGWYLIDSMNRLSFTHIVTNDALMCIKHIFQNILRLSHVPSGYLLVGKVTPYTWMNCWSVILGIHMLLKTFLVNLCSIHTCCMGVLCCLKFCPRQKFFCKLFTNVAINFRLGQMYVSAQSAQEQNTKINFVRTKISNRIKHSRVKATSIHNCTSYHTHTHHSYTLLR